jgi:hypothetical protein
MNSLPLKILFDAVWDEKTEAQITIIFGNCH